MKTELKKLKVKFEGRILEIDIQKELSINENLINSQLRESPSSYYIFCSLRDKYIKESNERFNNDYVSHKANVSPKYKSIYQRYLKAVEKANKYISICRAYESREGILRTLNANLRKEK